MNKPVLVIDQTKKTPPADQMQGNAGCPNFLSDAPLQIEKEKDLSFGHRSIATSLAKIIQTCPKPFTIGLFGKWGTGKTTIIQSLTQELRAADDAPLIANVDAWKYEEDSLRRQFLITLDRELKLGLNYEVSLNQTLTESDPTKWKIKFDWKWVFNSIGVIALIGIAAGLFLKVFQLHPITSDILFNFGLWAFLIQLALGFFQRVSVTVTEHRTDSAEGFERKFCKDVLNHSKVRGRAILIVIDNLDRCSDEKAVEMLSTIKTFLIKENEENKCAFLVACDDDAIKKHIAHIYADNSESYDADEFLRKFFNAFVRIPKFIDTELQAYTENLLGETNVPELQTSSDVAYVITNSFRENPRQIKQFINTLLAHFILAKEREETEPALIPKDAVTKNPAFLAKILVLQLRFPDIYKKIMKEHLTFEEAERLGGDKEYQDFMRATNTIRATDIQPFLYLKQSEAERKIPGFKELQVGLEDDKSEIVQEKIQAIKANPEQVQSLERLLPSLIESHRKRRTLLKNIVSCSLGGLQKASLVLQGDYYNKIADLFEEHGELKDDLERIEPSLVYGEVLKRCDDRHRKSIIKRYVELFRGKKTGKEDKPALAPDFVVQLFQEFLGHLEWLTDLSDDVKMAVEEHYFANTELLNLLEQKEDQKRYLSMESLVKLFGTLSDGDVEHKDNLIKKMTLIKRFSEIASAKAAKSLMTKASELLTNENKKPFRPQRENLSMELHTVFGVYQEKIADPSNSKEFQAFSDIVIQGIGAASDWIQKRIYIPLCLLLSRVDENKKPDLESQVQTFLASAELDSLKYVFDPMGVDGKQEVIKQYQTQLNKRVQQAQNIFDYFYDFASKESRSNWIINLICSANYERGLEKLKTLSYKVDDKKALVEKMLEYVGTTAPANSKEGFYVAINEMKCANDADLKKKYAEQIKSLLTQPKALLQQAGFKAYEGALSILSETHKRDIGQQTVEWMKNQSATTAGQPHTVRSVTLSWDILHPPVQKDFIYFVFDKLIKEGVNRDSVKLGFSVLQDVKPKYEDYHTYYDDVMAKINEAATDPGIKEEIKTGLSSLKPLRTNEKNKDFWSSFDELTKEQGS